MSESIKFVIPPRWNHCGAIFQFQSTSSAKPKGKICLVIDDFGYAHNETIDGFMSLDNSITLQLFLAIFIPVQLESWQIV